MIIIVTKHISREFVIRYGVNKYEKSGFGGKHSCRAMNENIIGGKLLYLKNVMLQISEEWIRSKPQFQSYEENMIFPKLLCLKRSEVYRC